MKISFNLTERIAGFVVSLDSLSNTADVISKELVGPTEAISLADRLENLQRGLLDKIPGLPPPGRIENLLILIHRDLSGTAYVNELALTLQVRAARAVKAGDPVYLSDIADIISVKPDIDIPDDSGVVMIRSVGWRRSLFYDLEPLLPSGTPRSYAIDALLARQELLLLGIPGPEGYRGATQENRISQMHSGLEALRSMLKRRVESESAYQVLLAEHPWMLGGTYSEVSRHTKLDDSRIPDFTALRCHDKFNDIIELKQPFLKLFREDGGFTSAFNDAWNQAEAYLVFAIRQRQYLRDDKNLRFENPRCILVIGCGLDERMLARLREKEAFAHSISIYTWDHLLETAQHVLNLVRSANQTIFSSTSTGTDVSDTRLAYE